MKIEDLYYPISDAPADDTNFDIEEWRQNNPMDYFKALYLVFSSVNWNQKIQSSIAMQAAFDCIYRVTRMQIPNTLFKFYSLDNNARLNKKKLKTLKRKQIFMSNIKDFNDPFDGKAFFYDPKELANIKRLTAHKGKLIDDFTAYHKGTALTENDISCMPMWAHYSNNHRGFCVSYDMKKPDNLHLCASTFPVQYTDQRLDVTSFMKEYANMLSSEIDNQISQGKKHITIDNLSIVYMDLFLCNIKQSTWQYEKEYRCTMATKSPGMPYVDASPKAIYIGMNCSEPNRKKLIDIAKTLSIPIYQMRFNDLSENYTLKAELL